MDFNRVRLLPYLLLLLSLWHLPFQPAEARESRRSSNDTWNVRLSSAQRMTLAEHPQWRVGTLLKSPFAQYDRRMHQYSGYDITLMEQMAKSLGVEVRWRHYPDQNALEQAQRRGEIDLSMGQKQTPRGLQRLAYSAPYLRLAQILVGERSATGSIDPDLLADDDALAVVNTSVARFLQETYYRTQLRVVANEREALRQVLDNSVRYAIVDEAQFNRLAQESEFSNLSRVGDIGYPRLLRIAIRQDWSTLAPIIDQALVNRPRLLQEQWLEQWITPPRAEEHETPGVWRGLSLITAVLLFLCLGGWFWQSQYQRQLEQRLASTRQELEQLRNTEERLRLTQFAVDESSVGILWVSWDSHIRYGNHSAETLLGYAHGELLERPLSQIQPGLDMDRWLDLWRRAREGQTTHKLFELDCYRADGSHFPADISLSFLRFADNEYLLVFLSDVSERRKARDALEESQARLQGIAANVPGMVFRLERPHAQASAEFAYISEGCQGLTGFTADHLRQPEHGIRSLVHPADRAAYLKVQQHAFMHQLDWHWQGRFITREGAVRWADIRARVRALGTEQMVWDGVLWDISDSKQIELELAQSRAQLRELASHLESVREEEKARIAREVHDELGQVLTVMKLETSMCELSYGHLDNGLHQRLQSMKKLIANLFQLVRDVASALRPPILDAGLASAIEWQARRFEERSGITCLVEIQEQLPILDDAKAIGLFRILQEALTNVLRHAQAHSVSLRLYREGQALCLQISDDGVGFAPDTLVAGHSFGLVGMRERVLMLGGDLQLDSQPGEGVTLYVRVPL